MLKSKHFPYQVVIFFGMFVGYMLYYYCRRSFSYVMPVLLETEGLLKSDLGLVLSSQTAAYSISKFVAGVVSDKLPPNYFFSVGLVTVGLSNIAFYWLDNVPLYAALWFVNGVAQGAGWPSCARVLRQWFTPSTFGTAWAVLSTSANVAGSLAPFITTMVLTRYGWRYGMLVPGCLAAFWSLVAMATITTSPESVGLPALGRQSPKKKPTSKSTDNGGASAEELTWRDLLASPYTYMVSLGYLIVFCTKTAAIDWGQLYLIQELGHDKYIASSFSSMVETGGLFGGIASGFLTDYLLAKHQKRLEAERKKSDGDKAVRHHGSPRLPAVLVFVSLIVLSLAALLRAVTPTSSAALISCVGLLLGFACYGPIASFGVMGCEAAPPQLAGTGHAIVSLGANLGGLAAGLPLTLVAKHLNWSGVLQVLIALNLAALTTMGLGRNIPAKMLPSHKLHLM